MAQQTLDLTWIQNLTPNTRKSIGELWGQDSWSSVHRSLFFFFHCFVTLSQGYPKKEKFIVCVYRYIYVLYCMLYIVIYCKYIYNIYYNILYVVYCNILLYIYILYIVCVSVYIYIYQKQHIYICCCSVAKLCPTLSDPRSMPGFSVFHRLPEFAQIHVH